ncbi:MAG: flagellar hook-basal body protein [Bacillota bacterium]|jgi:flagellar basal-body rod protein FlgG
MKISSYYLQTLQNRINIVGNNMANANTFGFKETLQSMEEAYDTRELSNTFAIFGGVVPGIGLNTQRNLYIGQRLDFSQGSLLETENPLDMAINGVGFFQVRTPEGNIGYTRAGLFRLDGEGRLVNDKGLLLEPMIQVPAGTSNINVKKDGRITGLVDGVFEDLGQILLARFDNPHGLDQGGDNLFFATEASGEPITGMPGDNGFGVVQGAMLERSNADVANAMTQLVQAQKAYQVELRTIKNQDEMFQQAIMMRG